jgi:hypothetical protein
MFARSSVRYVDTLLDRQPRRGDPKIYLQIAVGSPTASALAMVDTGATYSVLDADVAEELGAFQDAGVPEVRLSTRHGILPGRLVRRDTWLLADDGPALAIEATFWVSSDWTFGCVLGYSGLLDRVRFALDPARNRFYFGPLEDEPARLVDSRAGTPYGPAAS